MGSNLIQNSVDKFFIKLYVRRRKAGALMREGVVFEITKDHLHKGLRDIPVGYSSTSYVDPYKGVFYLGRSFFELVLKDPLEVIYLLFHGREGSAAEVRVFAQEIENNLCSQEFLSEMRKLTKKTDPLSGFSMALQLLGCMERKKDLKEDCWNIIAKLPQIAATVIQLYENGEIPSSCAGEKGYVQNFIEMLPFSLVQKETFSALFSLLQILFYDDEGGAIETFVGRVVSSASVDIYRSLSAALIAFSGDLVSFASVKSLELLQEIEEVTQGIGLDEEIEKILQEKLEKKELLFGFGHPSLRVEDSRATLLYNFARNHYPGHPLIKMALRMRYLAPKVLSHSYPRISNPFANVHAISGALLYAAGLTKTQYYPLLFALARSVGVVAQIFHEKKCKASLVHPHYFYRLR